jgi:hypothetical protein
VAANAFPTVAVDLSDLGGVDHVSLELRTCGGALSAALPHGGGGSFLVDDKWYRQHAAPRCHRLLAIAFTADGTAVGADSARVRQGDFSLSGDVLDGPTPVKARVRVEIGDVTLETDSGADGQFAFDHVPAGNLWRVSARESTVTKTPRLATLLPKTRLDATTPTQQLHLQAAAGPQPVDAFEPDDDLASASLRAPLAAGDIEQHSLADKKDIDHVPLAVVAGQRFRVTVLPQPPSPPDLALQLVDGSGAVVAHANDAPADFSAAPAITFVAGGPLFLRVTRSDDENSPGRYQVSWARAGVGP